MSQTSPSETVVLSKPAIAPAASGDSAIPTEPVLQPAAPAAGGAIETETPESGKTAREAQPDRRESRDCQGGEERRKSAVERRTGLDRRVIDIGSPTGLERRRGPGRRRTDDRRAAEEGEMTDEQFEFVLAIDTYKRLNGRPFPSWTEILEIVKQLGYRKVAGSTIQLPKGTGRSEAEG